MTKGEFTFEILINDTLLNIDSNSEVQPNHNKQVFSLINDFEDGDWRHQKFDRYIWDNIAQTALSEKERNCLAMDPYTILAESAKNLRLTDSKNDGIGDGSELAEIMLYGIMKEYYHALPVVPKIFYKQNSQDNAKGADSVHIVVHNGDFSLWFGEAKFYNSIDNSRLGAIIDSIADSLKTDKLKKENSIIRNVSDLDSLDLDESIKVKIKDTLKNTESIDFLKHRIHVPIFLLHECEVTKGSKELTQEYKDKIIKYHSDRATAFFKRQVMKLSESVFKYEEITFHIILFPVPEKSSIVERFVNKASFFKVA